MTIVPEIAWRLDCLLGEGPVWLPGEQALRFVDIKRGRLHRFDPATRAGETIDIGGSPSFALPTEDGSLVIGSGDRLHVLRGGHLGDLTTIPGPAGNRTNDATVDRHGRLWFGTMDDAETEPTGSIWCLDRGRLHRAGGEAVVTNGPAVSGDGRWLYRVDSGERTVWRHPLGTGPTLDGGEPFVRLDAGEGFPDGVVVDAEGCLWVALWDGWGVRRYDRDGRLLLHVGLPCARVTKIALGGPTLTTAYVTTARIGLSDEALAAQPLAGSLFSFEADVPGCPMPHVRLTG